ncbi:MAG TPA: sigma-70 family RNA polymerase sigma factor [Gaiellaceae bacterium]|jgi:RNA polymerase sigma factor (sigma-70 family)|nr:sigma-70 family RNA polymerase sigma factor [Gaiellaceae bacterium]
MLTTAECELIEQELPLIRDAIRLVTKRLPAHARDELGDELMLKAVELIPEWDRSRSTLQTFLRRRLYFAMIDSIRSSLGRKTRYAFDGDHDALYGQESTDGSGLSLRDGAPDPQRAAELSALKDLIDELPERERVAVTCGRLLDGAAVLGVSESRVSQLRSRAAELLKDAGALELLG